MQPSTLLRAALPFRRPSSLLLFPSSTAVSTTTTPAFRSAGWGMISGSSSTTSQITRRAASTSSTTTEQPPPPPPQQQQMMDMSMANAHGVMGAATTRDFSHLNDPSSMYPQNRPQSYEPAPFDFGLDDRPPPAAGSAVCVRRLRRCRS